ncbi:MAG: flavodoxin family protein [Bacilli bacterium]|jgi:multimeric flavodoxin WrbA|nr:flavodoxin family protein [Bacilli bacterium]
MKIVIINGSPNKNGYTNHVVDEVFKDFNHEIIKYFAYDLDVNTCIGCNYCFSHCNECIFDNKDQFRSLMNDVIECDLLVLASPLHFSSFSAKLLSVISRMQVYFPMKYEYKQTLPFKDKQALTIAVGGNDYPTMFDAIKAVDRIIYMHTNVNDIKRLLLKGSDKYNKDEFVRKYQLDIENIRKDIK